MKKFLFTERDINEILDNQNVDPFMIFNYLAGRDLGYMTPENTLFLRDLENKLSLNFKRSMALKAGHATRKMLKGDIAPVKKVIQSTHTILLSSVTDPNKEYDIPESIIRKDVPEVIIPEGFHNMIAEKAIDIMNDEKESETEQEQPQPPEQPEIIPEEETVEPESTPEETVEPEIEEEIDPIDMPSAAPFIAYSEEQKALDDLKKKQDDEDDMNYEYKAILEYREDKIREGEKHMQQLIETMNDPARAHLFTERDYRPKTFPNDYLTWQRINFGPESDFISLYYLRNKYEWVRLRLDQEANEERMKIKNKEYTVNNYPIETTIVANIKYPYFKGIYIPQFNYTYKLTKEMISGEVRHPYWDEFKDEIKALKKNEGKEYKGEALVGYINRCIENSPLAEDRHIQKWCDTYSIINLPEESAARLQFIQEHRDITPSNQYHMPMTNDGTRGICYDVHHIEFYKYLANAHITSLSPMREWLQQLKDNHPFLLRLYQFVIEIEDYAIDNDVQEIKSTGDYSLNPVAAIPEHLKKDRYERPDGSILHIPSE